MQGEFHRGEVEGASGKVEATADRGDEQKCKGELSYE